MGTIYKHEIPYGITAERELTQTQYDALTIAEKNNGTTYYIVDGIPDIDQSLIERGYLKAIRIV